MVETLCAQYATRDPFEMAKQRNIITCFEPLGNIRGYYNQCYRQKFIHINNDMPKPQQLMTCGHELGHAVMHPKANTPFLQEFTLFSVNRLENEANRFMVHLLYPDDELLEYQGFTVSQIACIFGLPESLVQYKFDIIKKSLARLETLH